MLLVSGAACTSESDAERAAVVAQKIKKNPKQAESILKEHDLTIEAFEKLMYDVAADPKLAEEFEAAQKKAK